MTKQTTPLSVTKTNTAKHKADPEPEYLGRGYFAKPARIIGGLASSYLSLPKLKKQNAVRSQAHHTCRVDWYLKSSTVFYIFGRDVGCP